MCECWYGVFDGVLNDLCEVCCGVFNVLCISDVLCVINVRVDVVSKQIPSG